MNSIYIKVELVLHLPNDSRDVRPVGVEAANAAHRPVRAALARILPDDAAVLNVSALTGQVGDAVDPLLDQGLQLSGRAGGLRHSAGSVDRQAKRTLRHSQRSWIVRAGHFNQKLAPVGNLSLANGKRRKFRRRPYEHSAAALLPRSDQVNRRVVQLVLPDKLTQADALLHCSLPVLKATV